MGVMMVRKPPHCHRHRRHLCNERILDRILERIDRCCTLPATLRDIVARGAWRAAVALLVAPSALADILENRLVSAACLVECVKPVCHAVWVL